MESGQSATDGIANIFLGQVPALGTAGLGDAPWWQHQVPRV